MPSVGLFGAGDVADTWGMLPYRNCPPIRGGSTFPIIFRFFRYLFSDYFCIFGDKARQTHSKIPDENAREQGGHLTEAPSSHSRTSPWEGSIILLLSSLSPYFELNMHTKAAPSASPLWEGARVLTNLGTMVAPSWHFRASWQGHGSMPHGQETPIALSLSLCHHHPRPCVACRDRILLRTGAVSRLHIEPKSTKPRCVPRIFIGHRHRRCRLTNRPLVARCDYNRTLARTTDAIIPIF